MDDGSWPIAEANWTEGMSPGPLSSSIDEWKVAGIRLGRAHGGTMWLLGDWWNAGAKFRQRRKAIVDSPEWLEAGGANYDDCKHYGSLAKRFTEKWRRLHSSPSFYQAVRSLSDTEVIRLLGQAGKENWTLNRIRREAGRLRNVYDPTGPEIADSLGGLMAEGKRYRAVLADPPWQYAIGDGQGNQRGGHSMHYEYMSLDELCALPVDQVVTDDGYLFLWCPAALLPDGLTVLKAWNFGYMTCAAWVKDVIGTGWYFRMRHELLLLGVRPASKPFGEKPDSVFTAPRRQHSEKPPIHDVIAAACGEGPLLEMFARRPVVNWTVIGDQIKRSPDI